jgi:large subunit ribosomal protein L12
MLHSAKKEINEANVKKILESAGIAADDAKVKALIASLQGVNIEDAMKQAVMAAPAAPAQAAPAAKKEEKKEEKKTEEEAAGGLASLFG